MQKWYENLWLFTEEEFNKLPDGFVLTSINGERHTKGKDTIDMDTRFGHIAFGVEGPLMSHPEAELLTILKLSV